MGKKLSFLEARDAMRNGSRLIYQRSGKGPATFWIEPGGPVSRVTFTHLRLVPNVTPSGDAMKGTPSQSWAWRT